MSIETEYRGYAIRWSDNEDKWACYDCKVSDQSLSNVKKKIDAQHRRLRKAAAVACFELGTEHRSNSVKVIATPGQVLEYVGPKRNGGWSKDRETVIGHRVASVASRDGRKAARQERDLEGLAPVTDEVEAAIAEANKKGKIAQAAMKEFDEAYKAIPRLTVDDMADLIEAGRVKIEES